MDFSDMGMLEVATFLPTNRCLILCNECVALCAELTSLMILCSL